MNKLIERKKLIQGEINKEKEREKQLNDICESKEKYKPIVVV